MASNGELRVLKDLIQSCPVIDNHAHNILAAESAINYKNYPLEAITSEAQGSALDEAQRTLSHYRILPQLAELFKCEANWDAIKAARSDWARRDYGDFVRKCLIGTHTLLLDDLLSDVDVEPYTWHDQYTRSPTKRILRIESVASNILTQLTESKGRPNDKSSKAVFAQLFDAFSKQFAHQIQHSINDNNVVGFKSVICYRTGLAVDPGIAGDFAKIMTSFTKIILKGGSYRISDKDFNDFLVVLTTELLKKANLPFPKPLQLHTGLGDSDISLVLANPAHLQQLVAQYPEVNFVLLHSSYPYTKEAGYLASTYPNVYLDLGEVFPMVSHDAQLSLLRESLDLTPTSRLLWSTDGHFHPETFYLANLQFRDALEAVLVKYVINGDMTLAQAMDATVDILFNNSNRIYQLGLSMVSPSSFPPAVKVSHGCSSLSTDARSSQKLSRDESHGMLDTLSQVNPNIFIWMQWLDFTATVRVRMFPLREFRKIVDGQRSIGITMAAISLLQDDFVSPGGTTTGELYMEADLSTFRKNVAISSNSATVMTFWHDKNGKEVGFCPRTMLRNIVHKLTSESGIDVLLGFEIEIVFLKASSLEPLTKIHSWSSLTSETRATLPLLEEIVTTLASADIFIEQFHPESSPGQFEFILPPAEPLQAVDTLITARQIITSVVEKHGLRATLYPRPNPQAAGTASHAHFSISPSTKEDPFLAGILKHFRAICAFSLAQEISYARVMQGVWAGGEWVTWGTQNREAPIRKISSGHWELKSLDGLANPYFAMTVLLTAGYIGIQKDLPLRHKDCAHDASSLNEKERTELGITERIPKSLPESLSALEEDDELKQMLDDVFVKTYCAVKRAEMEKLKAMGDDESKQWLVERY